MPLSFLPTDGPFLRKLLAGMTLAALTLGLSAAPVSAQELGFFFIERQAIYTQIDNTAPTETTLARQFTQATFVNGGDAATVELVAGPTTTPVDIPGTVDPVFFSRQDDFPGATGEADMLAAYPAGTYEFAVSGGALGSFSAFVDVDTPVSLNPGIIPFYNGTTHSDLQGMNSALPFTLTWDAFPEPDPDEREIFVRIRPTGGGASPVNTFVGANDTEFTIPASSLAPSTEYAAELYFGFGLFGSGAVGDQTYETFNRFNNMTEIIFTTAAASAAAPEPGTVFLVGMGIVLLARRRRK